MRSAQVVIVYHGGMGTEAEVELAKDVGCRILPVPEETGDLPTRLLEDPAIKMDLAELDPAYVAKASSHSVTPEDVVACVMKMLGNE